MLMQESFISFTKRELKNCVLLGISSRVTLLSKVIVFLTWVACSTRITFVKGIDTKSTCTRNTCIISTSAKVIRKLYLGPIHLADPGFTWSTLIHSKVLLIYLQVIQLAHVLTRSGHEVVSQSESTLSTQANSGVTLIHT